MSVRRIFERIFINLFGLTDLPILKIYFEQGEGEEEQEGEHVPQGEGEEEEEEEQETGHMPQDGEEQQEGEHVPQETDGGEEEQEGEHVPQGEGEEEEEEQETGHMPQDGEEQQLGEHVPQEKDEGEKEHKRKEYEEKNVPQEAQDNLPQPESQTRDQSTLFEELLMEIFQTKSTEPREEEGAVGGEVQYSETEEAAGSTQQSHQIIDFHYKEHSGTDTNGRVRCPLYHLSTYFCYWYKEAELLESHVRADHSEMVREGPDFHCLCIKENALIIIFNGEIFLYYKCFRGTMCYVSIKQIFSSDKLYKYTVTISNPVNNIPYIPVTFNVLKRNEILAQVFRQGRCLALDSTFIESCRTIYGTINMSISISEASN
ncbi:neurofilament medium polypeptide-like [Periplaneta americana]|uniref:neurofilament medium polypeptide-like n=1 Tax=Periplaneta americana TaxID=6978 RepID=UPI0037E8CD13